MDLVHDDRANIIGEEDRLSNLPDDIVHHILSYLDMKYVVQTCKLSKRWRHTWTSIIYLKLNGDSVKLFPSLASFAGFVKDALSHRNNQTEAEVELTFTRPTNNSDVINIINDICLHNVRQLTMTWFSRSIHDFPPFLFSSHTLRHLTLNNKCHHLSATIRIPKSVWDLPALETLYLSYMCFNFCIEGNDKSLSLFSKCVNLKDLTFHKCYLKLEIFNICCPKLSNLSITNSLIFPKAVNLVAPHLKNLTATVAPVRHKSAIYNHLRLSTEGFNSLETVNLALPNSICDKNIYVPVLLNMFKKFSNAKDLILDVNIIKVLSSWLQDQISPTPCPLNNLKSLKIGNVTRSNCIAKNRSEKVKNYLLRNSPNATFIMSLPKSKKRSRQKVYKDTMAKVAKLLAAKDEFIADGINTKVGATDN